MSAGTRGIISYAGFDREALWTRAKSCFIQAEDAPPERFASFLPLFPAELVQSMRYVGEGGTDARFVARNGFSIDPVEYHRQLYAEMPELYTGDNHRRNFDYEGRFIGRGVMTVDQAWVLAFPQYQPYVGERLTLYLIGNGGQAVAVPESIYPRGCGLLHSAETDMRVTGRGEHYAAYVQNRVKAGDAFDAALFESDYLETYHLTPVSIRQKELGRVMQDLSIVKSLKEEPGPNGLYTENAKRAEHVPQYAPYAVACDTFESAPITRNTARLMQLYYENDAFISDLWLPYAEASAYINRQDMSLDVNALCHGFQIPPRYDPETGGGRYPNRARVAVVRDRSLRPVVADALNNPAYGRGMSPLGLIHKWVLLPDSSELFRLRKLALEETELRCRALTVSAEAYRHMLNQAALQEDKGRLIDGMYRREAALSQMREGTPAYERARLLLDQRVQGITRRVGTESRQSERAQLSGYDADLDYLRRMARSREEPEDGDAKKPLAFFHDPLRMQSIESGYAMRGGLYCCRYEELALPEEPERKADAAIETHPLPPEDTPRPPQVDPETQAPGDVAPVPAESASPALTALPGGAVAARDGGR